MRTPKQTLADHLRRKEYRGCTGQVSDHGMGRTSIQIFTDNTSVNRKTFEYARINNTGSLIVADFDLS